MVTVAIRSLASTNMYPVIHNRFLSIENLLQLSLAASYPLATDKKL